MTLSPDASEALAALALEALSLDALSLEALAELSALDALSLEALAELPALDALELAELPPHAARPNANTIPSAASTIAASFLFFFIVCMVFPFLFEPFPTHVHMLRAIISILRKRSQELK